MEIIKDNPLFSEEYIETFKGMSRDQINQFLNGNWDNTMDDPSSRPPVDDKKTVNEMNAEAKTHDFKVDKFKALYQARVVLTEIGTMEERRICRTQLKRMKELGIKSV